MDFRKLTDDLNIISALGDNPNADNGLGPSGLKAKFDEAALKIKHFLNESLIPDLYTAVESEEFRGQPGLSPTVEAERFQDSTGSGVKLVITTPVPPDSGLLDSVISIHLYDGANGVTPKISNVDIEVLEYGADASAEISGPTNNLNLLLKIPRGEPGRDGQTTRNWLDNSDFRFAVNQRGKDSYHHMAGVQGIDRWTLDTYASTIQVTEDHGAVCNGKFSQELSREAKTKLYGRTVTAAIRDGYGFLYLASGNFNDGFSKVISGVTITLADGILSYDTGGTAMYNHKICLYDGAYTADTLPVYQYKGYAAELAECRRYYAPNEIVQPDWNQNDPTASDYVKNRTHYTEMTMGTVTIEIEDGSWVVDAELCALLAEHKSEATYIVDGVECSFGEAWGGDDSYWAYRMNGSPISVVLYCDASGNDGIDRIAFRTTSSGAYVAGTIKIPTMVETVHKLDPKYLPSMEPYVIDSEAYTYGDDALAAILEGRQILVKVPNKNGSAIFSNFMPVLQYQLPNNNNDYLILFYLKDGIAENLLTALQAAMQGNTSAFDGIYGVIEMMLSQSYAECPLKVSPIK